MCRDDSGDELTLSSVIPAKAGIHPFLAWTTACAGMTRKENHVERVRAISFSVNEPRLMIASGCYGVFPFQQLIANPPSNH
jgi:hypothetical protein